MESADLLAINLSCFALCVASCDVDCVVFDHFLLIFFKVSSYCCHYNKKLSTNDKGLKIKILEYTNARKSINI